MPGIKGCDQSHGAGSYNQYLVFFFNGQFFKGIDNTAHRFCKTCYMGIQTIRDRNQAFKRQNSGVGKSAVSMEPGDFHILAQVFPAGLTKSARTTAFSRPDNKALPGIVPDHHFMT